MIHSVFIQKGCRGNVSDAFRGQFVLTISAQCSSAEKNSRRRKEEHSPALLRSPVTDPVTGPYSSS